ncbi:hypothetical protein [Arcobacter porcinus]|uniref:hypothetical protein n=1 Tax=Arcobacter porcinus TaxID=1935204 RepID=UPI00081D76D6|nr:hypothetical protein [Arcobacter porcinus]OCL81896.1 hypothetical protein AAW29_01604 [Arcobacter porcinus]
MSLKIIKPKTRPVQIEPWFHRYLTNNEIKVVSAILTYADMRDRTKNSFPSNRTIAFYCGYDLIEKGKTLEKYEALETEEEKKKFKDKLLKYGINTVKATKRALIEKGILQTVTSGKAGKQTTDHILDLEWKKEQYLKEHDEFFNEKELQTEEDKNNLILKQTEELVRLQKEGNISKESLAKRLQQLSSMVNAENIDEDIPSEDIEKVANHIMNNNKIQSQLLSGKIANKDSYKNSITNLMKKGEFVGAKEHYESLKNKEKEEIEAILEFSIEEQEKTIPHKKQILTFRELERKDDLFFSSYISEHGQIYNFLITDKQIKYYLTNQNFTKENQQWINNYLNRSLEFLEKHKIKDKGEIMNVSVSTS